MSAEPGLVYASARASAAPPFTSRLFCDRRLGMRPLRRSGVNRHRSARKFRKQVRRTKGANMNQVMRGGIRF